MEMIKDVLVGLWESSGFYALFADGTFLWQNLVMILVSFVLLYFAIAKKCEPLLLVPIAFGILLANLPGAGLMDDPTGLMDTTNIIEGAHWYDSGVLRLIYAGVKSSIFPCIIFLGIGCMTDFGPLLSNPMSLLLGAAAQLGIYVAFVIAILLGFAPEEAASIAIIGGADGPLRPHRCCSILIYGADSFHSASHYESSHHRKRTQGRNETASQGFKGRKDCFPCCCTCYLRIHSSLSCTSSRFPYAR